MICLVPACLCPRLHNCCCEWRGWDSVNRFHHTSWMAVVTPMDRPKSVSNRCVIDVLGAFLYCHVAFLDFYVHVGAFVMGLSQISSLFSWWDAFHEKESVPPPFKIIVLKHCGILDSTYIFARVIQWPGGVFLGDWNGVKIGSGIVFPTDRPK